eukprot:604702-Pelagomonas_calceolata.AAC.1
MVFLMPDSNGANKGRATTACTSRGHTPEHMDGPGSKLVSAKKASQGPDLRKEIGNEHVQLYRGVVHFWKYGGREKKVLDKKQADVHAAWLGCTHQLMGFQAGGRQVSICACMTHRKQQQQRGSRVGPVQQ